MKLSTINKTIIALLLVAFKLSAQIIQGNFKELRNNEIILMGYSGFKTIELTKTETDSSGNFKLNYPPSYIGAAVLQIRNGSNIIVFLNKENMQIQWNNIKDIKSLQFTNSLENVSFAKGMTIGQEADMRLAGLKYVLPFYEKYPKKIKWLKREISIQEQAYPKFLDGLQKNSFAKKYLKIRKLLVDMPQTANRYIERITEHENDFASIDFNDDYLWQSGLMNQLFDGFYLLMESYIDAEKFETHANTASDIWIKKLKVNPIRQQEVAEYCFKLLEKRSQYKAAEHIALSLLNQTDCQIDEKRANLFEQYRKMAIGKQAPNIVLKNQEEGDKNLDLKGIESKYKLIVFGASWCPNCQTDYTKLSEEYLNLKQKYDIEIIYISIDEDKKTFENYYKNAPFITYCNTKGWDTQAAKDYHIFATPSYFLLDKDLKIIAKLNSPEHLAAWCSVNIKIN